ncbi:unnamed protein product [Onchocerca flexuosa]|uniref:Lipid-binding serum glycoprotein C-terminal domain-containing protein n=1 Tax=Onchocerca flexuosa TaxID=387005 RepID=A0A3P8APB0_9BILA|nr:unnamed protein product [Onchocerca flexuosa]
MLTININGLVFIYIVESNGKSHQAATFTLDIVANVRIRIENNKLLGKTTVDSFRLKNKFGNINISDDELSDIAILSSEMLQRSVNNFLHEGFPIPIPKVLRINITELRILDRSIFISADFELDRRRIRTLAVEAFAQTEFFPRNVFSGSARVRGS